MKLLAVDTAANLCAACVWDTDADEERGRCVRDIGKGHAEVLMGVIEEALQTAGCGYGDLGAVAVAVGPGSFTGIRVGVAAARGLALALNIPSAGVTTLDALMEEAAALHPDEAVMAAIDARRDRVYVAARDAGGEMTLAPQIVDVAAAAKLATDADIAPTGPVLTGSGAAAVHTAASRTLEIAGEAATADIATYARLAVRHGFDHGKPRPLYLREADARPQVGFALPRRGG